jgi:hypothetical protein
LDIMLNGPLKKNYSNWRCNMSYVCTWHVHWILVQHDLHKWVAVPTQGASLVYHFYTSMNYIKLH